MDLFHRGPGRVTVREAAERTGHDRTGHDRTAHNHTAHDRTGHDEAAETQTDETHAGKTQTDETQTDETQTGKTQTGKTQTGRTQADGRRAAAGAMLLDVREPYEWLAGHAPRAIHVPLSALEVGAPLPAEARGRPLIVVCRSGNRSRRAAESPAGRGAAAVDVIGGMRQWLRAGLPVVDQQGRDGTVA